MIPFKPVRYTGQSDIPVRDGQFLVDSKTGIISVDVGDIRTQAQYVYGITQYIDVNRWVPNNGSYYININDIVQDLIPRGHSVVGASLISGSTGTYTTVENSTIKIYSHDRISGNVLIFALPGSGYTENTDVKGLVALYHMEEATGAMIDSTGNTTIDTGTNWVFNRDYKYGYGSLFKSSIGHVTINGVEDLNDFTIEWWQYDTASGGDGGVVLSDSNGLTIETVPIAATSSKYISGSWKHIALSHKHDGLVRIYINGKLIGFSNVSTPLKAPFTFYGSQNSDGSSKACYIDELAVFNYARYSEQFSAPDLPYISNSEISIGVHSDIIISGDPGDTFEVDIPITTSKNVNLVYDTYYIGSALSNVSITNNKLTGAIGNVPSGEFYLVIRYPGSISAGVKIRLTTSVDITDSVDAVYVDGELYTPVVENGYTEYIQQDNKELDANAITITGTDNNDGVYVLDETTQTWSK